MTVSESTFDGWQSAVRRLRTLILSALAGARTGQSRVAERRLERAHQEIVHLATLLDQVRAMPSAEGPPRLDASRLSRDTPANRDYADKLREAWLAALAVDQERYGAEVGTDGPALIIELLLRDVEREIRGPAAEDRE